jgi:hypothetical protein
MARGKKQRGDNERLVLIAIIISVILLALWGVISFRIT